MSEVIQHISDTSFWVAQYRAAESERSDALFNDPFAKILVGDRSSAIQNLQSDVTKWTRWTVIMRTCIIDQMIQDLISQGVTTFLNFGCGLDSRPYRMSLGAEIQWIEVDFPQVIEHKSKMLQDYAPQCKLTRVCLDFSKREERKKLFAELAKKYSKVAILTEGVLPYLTEQEVSELSEDLTQHHSFKYWICEYISPKSYAYLQNPKRMKLLKNSPFQFYPPDWMAFFQSRGWKLNQEQYYTEISEKKGRPTPMPKFIKILNFFLGKKWARPFKKLSGYLIWESP